MSIAQQSKLGSIQALRGLAALAVALLHIAGMQVLEGARAETGVFAYGWVGVDLFFIISGFIMVWVTQGLTGDRKTAGRFLAQRAIRIYPLWWACALILGVFYMIIHGAPASADYIAKEQSWPVFIKSFFLIPQTLAPMPEVGWTLIFELFFYLVFAGFLAAGLRAKLPYAIIGWAVLTGLGLHLGWGKLGPVFAIMFSPLCFHFMAGMSAALLLQRQTRPALGLPALAIGCAGLAAILFTGSADKAARVMLFILPVSLIVYGVVALEQSGKLRTPKPLSWLGDISYALYLTHPLVIIAWRVLKPVYPGGQLGGTMSGLPPFIILLLDSALVIAACLITATIFHKLIEQTSLKYLRSKLPTYRAIPKAPL